MPLWRVALVVWAAVVLLLVASALLAYLRSLLAGPQEGLLFLQDQLWAQTRGEQRQVWRWLTWARLRAKPHPPGPPPLKGEGGGALWPPLPSQGRGLGGGVSPPKEGR